MSDAKLKIASVAKNLRLCVIENSIFIEELASSILGNILNIEWKKSKSFGHTSASLSFNQKLQLIQDIKGIEKEDLKKLNCLAQIRNKFAHVSEIDTFEKLFLESSVGKEIRNHFLKWFFDKSGESDIHPSKLEIVYRYCYYMLVDDVINILLEINKTHYYNLGIEEGKREFSDKLIDSLIRTLISQKQYLVVVKAMEEAKSTTN